jgi:hypothetical protein
MSNFWKSIISPFRKKFIQTADGFIGLAKSYNANKKVLDQVRNFVKATMGPEDKCGFVNMVLLVEDDVFNIRLKKRPEKYFEVLLTWQLFLISERFKTGEKEQDLHIIFEKAQEISKRQYKKLLQHFKTETPANKTMRLIKTYPFIYKNKSVVK